jgi:ArsR family transcriptional regulator, cadmium/lead-responsive transcriptional repressor
LYSKTTFHRESKSDWYLICGKCDAETGITLLGLTSRSRIQGEATASLLADEMPFSKHITALKKVGLIKERKVGKELRCSVVPEEPGNASQKLSRATTLCDERLQRIKDLAETLHQAGLGAVRRRLFPWKPDEKVHSHTGINLCYRSLSTDNHSVKQYTRAECSRDYFYELIGTDTGVSGK